MTAIDPIRFNRFTLYSKVASLLVMGLGLAAMGTWVLFSGEWHLWQTTSSWMKFNAALCLTLGGTALTILHWAPESPSRRNSAVSLSAVMLVVAGLNLLELITHWPIGIGEWFHNDPTGNGLIIPSSTMAYLVLGLNLVWRTLQPEASSILDVLSLTIFLSAVLILTAFFFGRAGTHTDDIFAFINLSALVGLGLLSFALLSFRVDRRWSRIVVSSHYGGQLFRRLAPIGVVTMMLIVASTFANFPPVDDTITHVLLHTLLLIILLGLARDMSQRVDHAAAARAAATAALVEQRQLYQSLFEGIDDVILLHDLEGRILEVNEAAVRRLGYSRDELLHMRTTELDDPAFGADFVERIQQQVNTGGLNDIVGNQIAKGGQVIPVHVNSRVIAFKGQPAVLAVVRDISNLRQAEQTALELALERERSEILARFIKDASHEFRTPLAILSLNLHSLYKVSDPDKRTQIERHAQDQIIKITTLLDQLVLLTTLETKPDYQFVVVGMADLLDKVRLAYANSPDEPRLEFHTEGDLPNILVDVDRLKVALGELIHNALRFSPASTKVVITGAALDGHGLIQIQDAGAGIPSTHLDKVFQRLYRQDVAHTTAGLGLGLPIAKTIIEGQRGQIAIESVDRQGTTVRVLLPSVATAPPPAASAISAKPHPPAPPPSV